jgi:hypothetical protein
MHTICHSPERHTRFFRVSAFCKKTLRPLVCCCCVYHTPRLRGMLLNPHADSTNQCDKVFH